MCACNGANRPGCSCDTSRYARIDPATMGSKLVPSLTCTVDSIRDLFTVFGARAYEVHLVHTRWSGGQRGLGSQYTVSDVLILPTPLVVSLDGVSTEILNIGTNETGTLQVSQVSPRFTEATLQGHINGEMPDEGTTFFYEINFPQPGGLDPIRRRFMMSGVPEYRPLEFQWTFSLVRAFADRPSDGEME